MSGCKQCGVSLWVENTSGYCHKCWGGKSWAMQRARDPEFEERRINGIRMGLMMNPERLAKFRRVANENRLAPGATEKRSAAAKKARIWEKSPMRNEPAGSPKRRAAAAKQSATKLAWCPPELRDEYKRLAFSKKLGAAAAKAIILEQHEADLRKLREAMGFAAPVEVREVRYFPDKLTPREPGTDIAAERQKAEKARIDALRQRRSLCSICGARSDIGCEHQVAA